MMVGMASRATAKERASSVRHGANVLRAIAANLVDPGSDSAHPGSGLLASRTAREALTLLAWAQPVTMGTLSGSLRLSQSACVRLVDRLEAGGLVRRQGRAGTRQTELVLTRAGRRSADRVVGETGDVIAGALEAAFPDPDDLSHFVAALDRLATVAAAEAPDVYRICRVCDVSACLAGGLACPSADACRAAADAGT